MHGNTVKSEGIIPLFFVLDIVIINRDGMILGDLRGKLFLVSFHHP